ncbi:uncharacterized protein [Ptychodera flava]|uniref:uncharacterized protein n=1 Tax=Ptychodera flava TaxID=63121 RepID=UPI00396A510C
MLNRCIVVSNIPRNTSLLQLKNHFQEEQNGGGEVTNVVYPLDWEEKDTAVITFAKESTVSGCHASEHVINGHVIGVRPLLQESWKVPNSLVTGQSTLSQCLGTVDSASSGTVFDENASVSKRRYIKRTARMSTSGKRRSRRQGKIVLRIPVNVIKPCQRPTAVKRTARMSTAGKLRLMKLSHKKRKRKN